MGVFEPSFSVGKDKMEVPVHFPEISQHAQGILGQWHQPILVTLGVTNVDLHIGGVDIANGEPDGLTKAQSHAVGSKEKDLVAQPVGCGKQPAHLFNRQDIRDPGSPWRFDERDVLPGLVKDPGVEELQAIQVKLDSTPGMFFQEFIEIIEQLIR